MTNLKKGDQLLCYRKEPHLPWMDITEGKIYEAAEDSYTEVDVEFVELVANDSDEPYMHYYACSFTVV